MLKFNRQFVISTLPVAIAFALAVFKFKVLDLNPD